MRTINRTTNKINTLGQDSKAKIYRDYITDTNDQDYRDIIASELFIRLWRFMDKITAARVVESLMEIKELNVLNKLARGLMEVER